MRNLFLILFSLVSSFIFSQKKEILAVMKEQETAWNKGDIEAYMQTYRKSDSLLFIGVRGVTYGWQQTLDNYKKGYPTPEKMGKLSFSDIMIKKLGRKHALVIGKWQINREKDSLKGIYTLVFEKFKNGWKIISDHSE